MADEPSVFQMPVPLTPAPPVKALTSVAVAAVLAGLRPERPAVARAGFTPEVVALSAFCSIAFWSCKEAMEAAAVLLLPVPPPVAVAVPAPGAVAAVAGLLSILVRGLATALPTKLPGVAVGSSKVFDRGSAGLEEVVGVAVATLAAAAAAASAAACCVYEAAVRGLLAVPGEGAAAAALLSTLTGAKMGLAKGKAHR